MVTARIRYVVTVIISAAAAAVRHLPRRLIFNTSGDRQSRKVWIRDGGYAAAD